MLLELLLELLLLEELLLRFPLVLPLGLPLGAFRGLLRATGSASGCGRAGTSAFDVWLRFLTAASRPARKLSPPLLAALTTACCLRDRPCCRCRRRLCFPAVGNPSSMPNRTSFAPVSTPANSAKSRADSCSQPVAAARNASTESRARERTTGSLSLRRFAAGAAETFGALRLLCTPESSTDSAGRPSAGAAGNGAAGSGAAAQAALHA